MDEQTLFVLSFLGILFLTCTLFAIAALIHRPVKATTTGFSWSRDIFFEHYVWVEESSLSGFPRGSRNQRSVRESYQYRKYSSSKERRVWKTGWRTRYFYEIQKWVRSRGLHTEGTERTTRHWPVYQLNQSTWERVATTQEKYVVFFQTVKGKRLKRELPENEWASLDEQATYTLKVNFFGHVKQSLSEMQQVITVAKQIP
jgi:hypothetical protein